MAATQFNTWAAKGHDWLDPTEYHWATRGFFFDTAAISGYTVGFTLQFMIGHPSFGFDIKIPSAQIVVNANPSFDFDIEIPGAQIVVNTNSMQIDIKARR